MKNLFLSCLFITCSFLFLPVTGSAQKYAQVIDYLKKNIKIYYLANPNVTNPDFREIKPTAIAVEDKGIVFGQTDNNKMDISAQLLMALFNQKQGDYNFQKNIWNVMQISKKPIVVNFINDVSKGIEKTYLPQYPFYVFDMAGKTNVWPATYPNSGKFGTGSVSAMVLGENASLDLQRLKWIFTDLVIKLGTGEHGAATMSNFPSGLNSYHIVSAVGNKFLTIKDANTAEGALLEIRDFNGVNVKRPAANQVWTLQEFGNQHHYFIKSRQGKVLDLKDGNTDNGSAVQMWSMWGNVNQRWQLVDAGGGYFYIKNWKSGKLLDVSGGVNANGSKVQNYQRNNSVSQKWRFVKTQGIENGSLISGEPTYFENRVSFAGITEMDINSVGINYSPQLQDEWETIIRHQLGISAKNRTNHYIGWSAAGIGNAMEIAVGRNWYPIADMKKVHVGKLCELGFFNAVGETDGLKELLVSKDEKDFNLHVLPGATFAYQIEKSIVRFDPTIDFLLGAKDCVDNWVKCGDTLVMEGEITPDDAFLANSSNPWFGNKNYDGTSALFLNQNIGMYGPWVNEEVHCNHPEIHPAEMIWCETADPKVKYLCIFQDDSDRFGSYSNFPDYSDPKALNDRWPEPAYKRKIEEALKYVHPWAKSPISGQFYVAIQIDPAASTKQSYTISVETSREVVTSTEASEIPSSEYAGKTRILKSNGVEVFKVTELQSNENDIAIRFELFKKKDSNIIMGYMVISAAVSRDLDGKEGYMVIRLAKQ